MLNEKNIKQAQINILSYALFEKKYIDTILGRIDETFLSNNAYKKTLKLIKRYWNEHRTCINYNTIESLFKSGHLKNETWQEFVSTYTSCRIDFIKDDGDLDANIDLLVKQKQRFTVEKFISKITEDLGDIYKIQEHVKSWNSENEILSNNKNQKITSINPFSDDSVNTRIDAYTNPEVYQNLIKTGFQEIDEKIGGMQKSELCYIVGRKGHGKSILMQNLGYNMWKQENNVLFITLEIKYSDYLKRIDSFYTGINALKFKSGIKNKEETEILKTRLKKLAQGYDENDNLHTSRFIVEELNINSSINKVENSIKKSEEKYGIIYDVVVIDYASLLQPNITQREDRLKHGQISNDLKDLAKKMNKLIITGAQMNRIGEKSEFGSAGNVANSDAIFDAIDWGIEIILNPDLVKNTGTIRSSKCRDGEHFNFDFLKKYETFKIEENPFGELGKALEEDNSEGLW